MIQHGCTFWARQTIDSDVFSKKPHVWFKIWFYIINKVHFADSSQFPRGTDFFRYDWFIEKTGAKKSEVDHCIRWMKSATMIATRKATRGLVISVLNYNTFQDLRNYKSDTKSDTKSDSKAKQKRNKSETINNKGNNDKKVITVANATPTIKVGKETFMVEELTYEYESKPSKSKYGNKTMAVLARKFAELADIEIPPGEPFDASSWSKPLGEIYRHFDKDVDKTIDYLIRAAGYFITQNLSFTPFTLAKNILMIDKWVKEQDAKKYNPNLYE